MDYMQILGFTLVALLLVVSPGPNGLLIAKTVPSAGRASGFANVAGFIAAFYVHGALSILGVSVILMKSAEAFFIFKLLGAAYLIWIGIKSLLAAWRNVDAALETDCSDKQSESLGKSFFEGFLTNTLNPKVSMFYLAAFPQFISLGESALLYGFLLVSIHAFMNAVWFALMVVLFAHLSVLAKQKVFHRALKGLTGAIFVSFGAKLLSLESK